MNIYLLPRKKGKYLLHSKEFQNESSKDDVPQKPRKYNRLLNLVKSGYKSVTAKRERNEKLLKEMTSLSQINVYYPSNLSEEEASEIYNDLIQSQIKKHKRWLIMDGALLLLSAILTLVPGPNLLMAYLAWRTLAHYKTKKGGERTVGELEIYFVKEPHLEEIFWIVNKRFVFKRSAKIQKIKLDLRIGK